MSLPLRLIACFDVKVGRVTKALRFEDNVDVADADDLAERLSSCHIDEIIFFDIMASVERRPPDVETVERVARSVTVPFTVGGGIATTAEMRAVLKAGAEKVSIDSMAVRRPQLIDEGALRFGSQCVVLSMQVRRSSRPGLPSGYEVRIDGGRVGTGLDAVEWARQAVRRGAGEICLNSIDRDGTMAGYELMVTRQVTAAVQVPVIASGGAGAAVDIAEAYRCGATGAIISSLLYSPRAQTHSTVGELKRELAEIGIPVRPEPIGAVEEGGEHD